MTSGTVTGAKLARLWIGTATQLVEADGDVLATLTRDEATRCRSTASSPLTLGWVA